MASKKATVEKFYLTLEGPALPVQITVDRAAKAVYVRVRLGKVAKTVEVEEGVLADVDHLGFPLGFEILYARPREGLRPDGQDVQGPGTQGRRLHGRGPLLRVVL